MAPQIKLRDATGYVQNLVLSTNREYIVIEGLVDENTTDIQVSVNGGPYQSSPSLVKFDLPNFTVPNLTAIPTGLSLTPGENTISIRTISIVGSVSAPATAFITRVPSETSPFQIPTGIKLRRLRNKVTILAANPIPSIPLAIRATLPDTFLGLNIYASTQPSGGTTGYFKVNSSLVTQASAEFDETALSLADELTTWDNTNQKSVRLRVTEQDAFGYETSIRLDQTYDVSALDNKLRFSSKLEDVTLTEYLTFTHDRNLGLNSDQFTNIPATDPLYYVVTAVYYDTTLGQEIESSYSQEVLGAPLIIDTTIRDLPERRQQSVVVDFMRVIQRTNAEISLLPGSSTRDVSIDPFSSEASRIWFILDFVHRSGSFLTLLQIDDANGDGVSDPVVSSSYKQALKAALGITQDAAVQSLINQQFDKLAGNKGKTRLPGRPAIGQAVFYTVTRPAFDLPIPAGTFVTAEADSSLGAPSVRYRVGGTYTMLAANADAYYNFDRKRYEITVDIVAEEIGEDGNRPAGQIKTSQGVAGLSVTNLEATVFGRDQESNNDLAVRSQLAFVSVDTGTEGGYYKTSAEQVGIIKTKVIKSGDILMMRDYDPVRHKHIGGKVDIWVQGVRERQVADRFAFTFAQAFNINCTIVDIGTLTFRVEDSRVTPTSPIIEVLNNVGQGLGVQNNTTGLSYDLTGVVLVDYQTFRLNTSIVQPITSLDDIITADYRFRATNKFIFSLQPVRRVVSVVGEVSGPLDSTLGYDLYKIEDPLLNGESTIASDYLSINQVGGIPTGNTISVNDESHVLIGFFDEPLLSIGINTATIRVYNEDRSIEYDGPGTSAPDFDIVNGTSTTPAKIVRTSSSTIQTGQQVSVDYIHDENFTVNYVINDILQETQKVINVNRHVTGDPIVKQAIQNSVELETTVQLNRGATKDKVDPLIRTNVSIELDKKLLGENTAQGDIIHAIDATAGVDYPIVPFARMAYADGSRKMREPVLSSYTTLPSLNIGGNIVYILNNSLRYPTTDGGGLPTEHRGVFQDDELMVTSESLVNVANGVNQSYVIGSGGATITGYSDVATLISAGFTTSEAQAEEYLRRTANRVVVSLLGGTTPDVPTNHVYTVSYVIRGDKGAKDLTSSNVEYLDLGKFTLTFREAVVS